MKHTFNIDHNSVRLVVSHKGKKYRKATGVTVPEGLWDSSAKKISGKCKDRSAWDKLRPMHIRLLEVEDSVVTEADVEAAMEYALTGKKNTVKTSRPTFWEYFREWGERPSPVQRQRRLYPNVISKLMGEAEDWEQIDSAYYFRLCRAMDDYGCSVNYKGAIVSKLKAVMSEGFRLKYHTNEDFRQFKVMSEVPETIALTQGEVDALCDYKTKSSIERKVVDLAIIGIYSVARWEDFSRLSMANVADGMLSYAQLKTEVSVVLPASPKLVAALERNGGHAPALSQQKFNEYFKEVCKKIGMTQKVHVARSKGAERITESKERWELATSHTCRRTGCTLLYLSGVPMKRCMMISGHTTEQNFLRYIRVTKGENAKLLAKAAFFQ